MSIAAISESPACQVQYWATFRPEQKKKQEEERKQRITQASSAIPQYTCDSKGALQKALGDDLWEIFQSSSSPSAPDITPPLQRGASLDAIPFIGTVSASLGFILDFASIPPVQLEDTSMDCELDELPWQLRGCGFNKSNALVFT